MSLTTDAVASAAVIVGWTVLPATAVLVGWRNLRASGSRAIGPGAVVAGILGLGIVGVVLSPVAGRALETDFAPHMAQHLALGLVGPLLIAVGRVPELVPWVVAGPSRRTLRRWMGPIARPPRSVLWPALVMVAVWFWWHVPALYRAAADVTAVHAAEHLSFLAAGLWYWTALAPHRRRTGAVVLAPFGVTIALGLLGSVLTLSGAPFYADAVTATTESGQLADQHLGGLLMWTPGGLVHLCAAVVQLVRWLEVDGAGARAPAAAGQGAAP